ncbi:MAG: hypothetical protein H5U37_05575 [Caldisericia bacterium]|nr:hypothetical protein [Caldisericia bacterium]
MKKLFICLLLFLLFLSGCKNPNLKNMVPFLSNNFLSESFSNNEVFINYWDVEKGKIYLNFNKLYLGYKQGVHSSVFPYFWDGEKEFFVNCDLKEIFDKNIRFYKTIPQDDIQYSLFYKNPVYAKFIKDKNILRVSEQINGKDLIEINEYEIRNDQLPLDIKREFEIIPLITFELENGEKKIIFFYTKEEENNNLKTKIFLIEIKNNELSIIQPKGFKDYSILHPFLFELPHKNFFIKNNELYLKFSYIEGVNLEGKINISSIDLNSFEIENVKTIDFEKINLRSLESEGIEGYIDTCLGFYKDYLILYNPYEIIAIDKNNEIIGRIKIFSKDKRLEVYKGEKLTQKIEIKRISDIMFPNLKR